MLRFTFCVLMLVTCIYINAQTNISDCAGAIVLCGDVYSEDQAPLGTGDVYEYTGPCNQNLETMSLWYTFTVQQSGDLSFIITPNDAADDYDWGLFDITTGGCAGITPQNIASPTVSCNSYGQIGLNGATGISTAMGGQSNVGGPGNLNGPPFNINLPVLDGQTYALVVMNWSNSLEGYTIDFGESTASLYDQVPPNPILLEADCNNVNFVVTFSEAIMVATAENLDFILNGPGGSFTMSNVLPATAGSLMDDQFNLSLAGQVFLPGNYSLVITDLSGSVEDACGNAAIGEIQVQLLSPLLYDVQVTTACNGSDGSIEILNISGGEGPYEFNLNDVLQPLLLVENVNTGNYVVTVIDDNGCSVSQQASVPDHLISLFIPEQDSLSCDQQIVTINGILITPEQDVSYSWSFLEEDDFVPTGDTISNPIVSNPGLYQLTITNVESGCTAQGIIGIATSELAFDVVPPEMNAIQHDCPNNAFTLFFSEQLMNSTVQTSDFQLSGPGGVFDLATIVPMTPNSITDSIYYFTLSDSIDIGGTYQLNITDNSGSVEDPCSNPASNFLLIELYSPIQVVTSITASCNGIGGEIQLSDISGGLGPYNVYLNDELQNNNNITDLTSGVYQLEIEDAQNCNFNVSIDIPDNVIVIDIPALFDTISCLNPVITISGIEVTSQQGVTYSWAYFDGINFIPIGPTDQSPSVSQPGIYEVTVALTESDCTASAQIEIIGISPLIDEIAPTPIQLLTDCGNETFIVFFSEPVLVETVQAGDIQLSGPSGFYTPESILAINSNGSTADSFEFTMNAPIASGGNFILTITNGFGSIQDPCGNSVIGSFSILLVAPITFETTTQTACNGVGGAVQILAINGGAGPYDFFLNNILQQDLNAENLNDGNYSIEISDALNCSVEMSIEIPNNEISVAIPDQDTISCQNPVIQINELTVMPEQQVTYSWGYFLDDEYVPTGAAGSAPYFAAAGLYQLTIENVLTGCVASTTFELFTEELIEIDPQDIRFPNIFTPNKDSQNEDWVPFLASDPRFNLTEIFSEYHLKIYNRWGSLVFDSDKEKTKRWSAQDQESGTYFFILDYKISCGGSIEDSKEGTIQLLR